MLIESPHGVTEVTPQPFEFQIQYHEVAPMPIHFIPTGPNKANFHLVFYVHL